MILTVGDPGECIHECHGFVVVLKLVKALKGPGICIQGPAGRVREQRLRLLAAERRGTRREGLAPPAAEIRNDHADMLKRVSGRV